MTTSPLTDSAVVAPPSSDPPIPRSSWLALVVILVAEMLDGLDALITSIGGPALLADLEGGPALLQWTAAAYTLSMASGLLIGGRLGDMFGKRRLFLIGMVGFTLGSLLSACAPVAGVLILGRVLQGLLGALMLPQGMGMIRTLFPGEHAAKAFGLFGPMMMVAGIGGPILAGVLMDLDPFGLSWRSLFAVNVIPCALAIVAGIRLLPREDSARSLSLDWTGAVLSAAAMAAIVYPLVEGRELGWPAWTLAMLAAGITLLGVFLLQQRRRSRAGRDALIEPSLFRNRTFLAGLAIMLVFFGGTGAIGMLTALFLQMGLG
ncbi:MFS transporter [Brachybacterium subflavum]|uniref:MFS transporter n=1 Tax=Brachybacterium subflavum TaxID=2585206 RepID=UPI0012666217|nr:MFS transporter [Brachybacterium subflavum]